MPSWYRDWRDRFYQALDSDDVRTFQVIVYAGVLAAGVYMSILGAPSVVQDRMGVFSHHVWVTLTILGPVLVIIGDRLSREGHWQITQQECTRPSRAARRLYYGWYMQAAGDFVAGMVYLTYVIAAFSVSWLHRGIFSAYVVAALCLCSLLLTTRDLRRVRQLERM